MLNSEGKKVKGFKFNKSTSDIIFPPKHYRIAGKDYITIAEENGQLNILNRVGKPRILASKTFDFSNTPISLENTELVVIEKDNTDELDVNLLGSSIRYNEYYKKEGVNVNFIEKISNESFKIRTYERGVENETLACGTGSTASAICMNYLGKSQSNNITMKCRGGDLKVEFISKDNLFTNISITGPAKLVFEGQINI